MSTIATTGTLPVELLTFPLMDAIFTRRARRFGLGMEIPTGPLAFKSRHAPLALSPLEQAVLVAARPRLDVHGGRVHGAQTSC